MSLKILRGEFCSVTGLAVLSLIVLGGIGAASGQETQAQVSPSATSSSTPTVVSDSGQPPAPPGGTHVFGVLPNYRTVEESAVHSPLTTKQKFTIATKDSFDYPLIGLSAALAGISQWSNSSPSFGQGTAGYGKRLGTNYADQTIGNFMTEAIYPTLLREDPRYYRRGTGSGLSRAVYAVTRVLITHTDSGKHRFNYSEWVGNATAVAISNAYYPDNRDTKDAVLKLMGQVGTDAVSQVLKEFWPDMKRKFFTRHHESGLLGVRSSD